MPRTPRLISAAAAIAASALIMGAFAIVGVPAGDGAREAPALTVMTLAALRGTDTTTHDVPHEEAAPSPPSPVSAAEPAATEPIQVQIMPAVEPLPPPVLTLAALTPRPAPNPAEAVAGATSRAIQAAVQAATGTGAPATVASSAAPARRGIAEGLAADAPAGNSLSYAARVRSWLLAHKIYPKRARMRRQEGVALIRFVLDRGGRVLDHRIERSSGHAVLDQEVLAMLDRATPFPAAPQEVTGSRMEFLAPIAFLVTEKGGS